MNKRRGFTLIELIIVVAIILVIVAIVFNGGNSINDNDFSRIMAQENIQNPVKGSYQFSACSEDDTYNSSFSGTKNGVPVSGVLCKGYFKGITIRYF